MLDEVESNDNDGGDGDEDVGADVCNINGLLAEEYILGKLVPKTRRQYQLCVIKMKDWIKTNYPGEYNSSLEEMKLPLSEKAVIEFFTSVSIHKKKVSAGGAPSTVSISTVNLCRSAFKKHCSDRRVKIPESIFQSISDFCAGFKRKVDRKSVV